MTNIELYINKQLCDIQSPEKLGIRLNRVLINPSELNTKDAQYSYSITIPSSATNDAIFGYANVEEVKNKFNHNHTAQLYVDSVKVFDGRFKLSEIDAEGSYKGNLVVPAKKTVKEIFGETKMNEIKEPWILDFSDTKTADGVLSLTEMLNKYNTMKGTPDCIFPLVLYGLLPKVPESILQVEGKETQTSYSGKTLWDKHVRFGVQDFPPSINCMKTIQHIFGKKKGDDTAYNISGSAFDDERLSKLYMSYQNPTDFAQEWNWGHLGKMRIKGSWSNYRVETKDEITTTYTEQKYSRNEDGRVLFATNLLNATGTNISYLEDHGTNIIHSENELKKNDKTYTHSNTVITIPQSGLYKISLSADMNLHRDKNTTYGSNPQLMSSNFENAKNDLFHRAHEIKLLRDYGSGEFDLDELALDAYYYEPNLKQNNKWEEYDKEGQVENTNDFPKYFPVPGNKCVQFVDPIVNEKLLSGFRWGDYKGSDDRFPIEKFKMAIDRQDTLGRILAIKHGWSRDVTFSQKDKIFSAINNSHSLPKITPEGELDPLLTTSAGYWVYGLPDMDPNDAAEDDPNAPSKPEGEGEEVKKDDFYGWYPSQKFKVEVADACFSDGSISAGNHIETTDYDKGKGRLHQVVWLNKGEHITLVAVSDAGVARKRKRGPYMWMRQDINFDLEIRPFRKEWEWITINNIGTGTAEMKWNAPSDFLRKHIDLVKFLPSEQKIDEWLDNFCKAFNLELTQPEDGEFELNVKQTQMVATAHR